jgi:hypothetical protein
MGVELHPEQLQHRLGRDDGDHPHVTSRCRHCEQSKAIHSEEKSGMDCFVPLAALAVLAMTGLRSCHPDQAPWPAPRNSKRGRQKFPSRRESEGNYSSFGAMRAEKTSHSSGLDETALATGKAQERRMNMKF